MRLGGVSELAAQVGALLAWLAAAASGGLVLARWLRAGGSPLRRTATAAPPAVILGHVSGGLLGLVLWAAFMLSGWAVLAWIALGLLAPVAGVGMAVLVLGLPARGAPDYRPAAPDPGSRGLRARAVRRDRAAAGADGDHRCLMARPLDITYSPHLVCSLSG